MSDRPSSFPFRAEEGVKRHAPATLRNRDVITELLRPILPATGLALELASGTGEHIVHFASEFPAIDWQPSDCEEAALASIAAWASESGLDNIRAPLHLDVLTPEWPVTHVDAILCINMVHISPWSATGGMMAGAGRLLTAGAPLYLYGPYFQAGEVAAESNIAFDRSLRERNPDWGIRDVGDMIDLAGKNGLELKSVIPMPANNMSLIFRKTD